jgi:hypothetical protein
LISTPIDFAEHISPCDGRVGIEHECGPLEPRRDLQEQIKPLASQRGFGVTKAGGVPTRAVEPGDDAAADGVGHARKDDRDRPRLPLEGSGRRGRACQDDVGSQANQLLRERSYSIGVSRLNAVTMQALGEPALISRFADLGFESFPRERQTPEALGALQKADAEKWWPIIKELGIKAE